MKRILPLGLAWLIGSSIGLLAAENVPLQYSQNGVPFNLQSQRGAPISNVVSNGSDGRMPLTNSSYNSVNPPTAHQFAGLVSFGGVPGLTHSQWIAVSNQPGLHAGTNAFSASVAAAMQLPVARTNGSDNNSIAMVLRRAEVGAPFLSRQVSFSFGSVIPVPLVGTDGALLTNSAPTDYWLAEPWTTNSHANDQFYWSPNASCVFAVQSGPIAVTWRRSTPFPIASPPPYTNLLGSVNFETNGANVYELYTVNYVVSGNAVKQPQKIYWTEGVFQSIGYPVTVPQDRVSSVHVIFNSAFPQYVAQPYSDPNTVNMPGAATNSLQEYRTLWMVTDGQIAQIHAYNAEGRVFVELLGASTGAANEFLGFEIVDVYKTPSASDVTVNLGERLTAYQDGSDDSNLDPWPIQNTGTQFYYQQSVAGSHPVYWADKATQNQNDLQIYWLLTGVGGLEWPYLFDRYSLVWPDDATQYSHYLRPQVDTAAQAALTAVQLDSSEAPTLDYQDPLDQPRGFLTANYAFYTFLTPDYPAHRALLRFISGSNVRFERVFSWLDAGLKNNSILAGSVATDLSAWNTTNSTLNFSNLLAAPYILNTTANVGARINAPANELGSAGSYWAGYIMQTNGTSFNIGAYIDPFVAGFGAANLGAIIPVNAIPGSNLLEVWWFRKNDANPVAGFQPLYWPSVIGRYTLQWPANAREIVMAGNAGSGALSSLESKGGIYYQNNRALPGYNPNEEHALMLGGQVYALRDDLNVTTTNGYSSAPYVLLGYGDSDGRPSMSVFKVRREKPEAGILFDYIVNAGTQLQAPMPLPLMAAPVDGTGALATNYNTEPPGTSGDLPVGWQTARDSAGIYSNYPSFTFQDRKHNFWVYRGPHAGLPPLQAGHYVATNGTFGPLPNATAVVNQPFSYSIHVSRQLDSLTASILSGTLPTGLSLQTTTNGFAVAGNPDATNATPVSVVIGIQDTADNSIVSNTLSITVAASGSVVAQGPMAISCTNIYTGAVVTYSNRPPSLAQSPTISNSFTMRFYYKTLPGFAWPGSTNPPAVGSIVPYLTPANGAGGFLGDPSQKTTPSLDIVYRPAWPELDQSKQPLPTLYSGQTLTAPINGLPAVRGQTSVQVLYQQSVGQDITDSPASVVLYDPTVQKKSSLQALGGLPSTVVSSSYMGNLFFQNLPPNLVNRLYFDPSSTNLIFQGQFVDDIVGEKYLLLNVLRGADLAAVQGLCDPSDPNKSDWDAAVENLSAQVYTFHEKPGVPGSYVVDPAQTVSRQAANVVEISSSDTAVDSYALGATGPGEGYVTFIVGNGRNPALSGDPITVYIIRVAPPLFPGQLKVVEAPSPLSEMITFQHTGDLAGHSADYQYDWRIMPPVDGQTPTIDPTNWTVLTQGNDITHYTLGGSGIQALSDNYVTMRYRCINPLADPAVTNWSAWADPILAEGWIKRVLQGINPFDQRTTDLFDNPANTTASIISQAGHRWEGDVPLNEQAMTNSGLIEIYETVLNRGKSLSINAGYNYGPANDALLLAAGYLNDLYMMIGNDAWANAANPTIGFGTADKTYGNIATALFCFMGQEPSLLEQNLALLRGRDDTLSPGVTLAPVYNRLFWNYTYGINSGEVVYALNYNITDQNGDGVVNAADAAIMYPQAHGDAYGHYLTALNNYYSLLMNPHFDWVPRAEAVTVLGATVAVDYQDERKFASAAAALARTGRQVLDLTWREDYQPGTSSGWGYFGTNHVNTQRSYQDGGATKYVTRYWGLDHWASRVSQGSYLNWVVGNAILPPVDTDPTHEGIQKVDRTTVPELKELPQTAAALENDMDNANAGFTPLGLAQNSIPFDINPLQVTGTDPQTHFEQVYDRAVVALNNAVVAFDDAQNVTQLMRSEEDSLDGFSAGVTAQELAYNDQLIELYGTPYPDDIGPGQTYPQGYTGPDLVHYTYVDNPDTNTYGGILPDPTVSQTYYAYIGNLPSDWQTNMYQNFDFYTNSLTEDYSQNTNYIAFNVGPNGFFSKPNAWTSERVSPGSVQQAISALIAAQNQLRQAVSGAVQDKQSLDRAYYLFQSQSASNQAALNLGTQINAKNQDINDIQTGYSIASEWLNYSANLIGAQLSIIQNDIPDEIIVGLADGGDELKLAGLPVVIALDVAQQALLAGDAVGFTAAQAEILTDQASLQDLSNQLATNQNNVSLQSAVDSLGSQLNNVQGDLAVINQAERGLSDARAAYNALVAKGNRIQQERLTFRQHAAAVVQGYRTRNAAFRLFQNEKLERYKTLFDLAAKYAYLSANAYDYETGLLNTPAGQSFVQRIVGSCALGVIENGQPQYAGSDTGDPGLSSALAEMKADWDVLKSRLGFNNPDGYGTTVSLRSENFRILSSSDGDNNWRAVLQQGRTANLLTDSDVMRYCMQIDDGTGQPVPGIVLTFATVISDGQNLFGQQLAPGDHNFSPSSFATKIFSVGVDFDGYIGMDNPTGVQTSDPTIDPNGLAATPYCYLIPVGADSMRSPPLGDVSAIRTWNVDDVAIPLPFNISDSDFSTAPFYTASDSLSEPLFAMRKHQAFRPVSSLAAFNTSIYGASGALQPSQYTNKRLIGRSIWNSKWKLVIPAKTLLADPNQGLNRFINTVKDIKLYFITYSYSGN